MNYDRYVENALDDIHSAEDEAAESFDEHREEVIDAFKNGQSLRYNYYGDKWSNIGVDRNDLCDRLLAYQTQLMIACVNDDDAEIIKIVKTAFEQEIDSIVDLVWR